VIVKRGKSWGVRVHVGGKRRWVGTFSTRAAAKRAEAEAMAAGRNERGDEPTCDEYVEFFLVGYQENRKASSYRTARQNLGAFAKEFVGRDLGSISPLEAERWSRANRHRVQSVSTLFNDAIRKQLVGANPFRGLGGKGRGRKDLVPLTEDELRGLAAAAQRPEVLGDYGLEFASLILFAGYTGLRAGELFALEWRDIDFAGRRLYVRRRVFDGHLDVPKSGTPERVLSPHARDAILPLREDRELVFASKQGQRLSQSIVAWYWPSVWAAFGRRVTLHELRHFAGHFMYVTLGLPARVVAVQLGHDGPEQVERARKHRRVGRASLDAAFSRKPTRVPTLRVAEEVADSL